MASTLRGSAGRQRGPAPTPFSSPADEAREHLRGEIKATAFCMGDLEWNEAKCLESAHHHHLLPTFRASLDELNSEEMSRLMLWLRGMQDLVLHKGSTLEMMLRIAKHLSAAHDSARINKLADAAAHLNVMEFGATLTRNQIGSVMQQLGPNARRNDALLG